MFEFVKGRRGEEAVIRALLRYVSGILSTEVQDPKNGKEWIISGRASDAEKK